MNKIAILMVFIIFSCALISTILTLRPFGEPKSTEMDDYIIKNAQNETGSNNAVTSVVFDYRGFDTLGEATVLFTAVAGVLLVLRRNAHE
ncbi:MAG: hypothetical protein J7L20_05725 [Thermoplasmata archaeon]|nr:hypothetical protein [Thermoplasmata archaeon]